MYKTELHAHCAPVSRCASASPELLAEMYAEAGYTSLVLVNHLNRDTFEGMEAIGHRQRMDYYLDAYERLCRAADGRLHVLPGAEVRVDGSRNDYLCFGLDADALRALSKDVFVLEPSALSARVHELGGLIIQAHPMRFGMTLMNPARAGLDGFEVYNAHAKHDSHNRLAALWADNTACIRTSGSDFHDPYSHIGGGIVTDAPITSNEMLLRVLRDGNYTLIQE